MTAIERLEFFLDKVRAATFAVPLVWLGIRGADWFTDRFFMVDTPGAGHYVSTLGNWVYGGALLVIGGGCLGAIFESLKQLVKGLDEKEREEWRSSWTGTFWDEPPAMGDGAIYVTKRTWQLSGGLVLVSLLAFANGRIFAWLEGSSFWPTVTALRPVGVFSIFIYAMAIRSCFSFANQEAKHGKMGNPTPFLCGYKLYCVVPFCIFYEVAGALANVGEPQQKLSSMALFIGLIVYFVFTRSMVPFTKWLDEHAQMDRMAAPTKKPKPSATPKDVDAGGKSAELGKGIRRRRD